jgi:hypothetical protein
VPNAAEFTANRIWTVAAFGNGIGSGSLTEGTSLGDGASGMFPFSNDDSLT